MKTRTLRKRMRLDPVCAMWVRHMDEINRAHNSLAAKYCAAGGTEYAMLLGHSICTLAKLWKYDRMMLGVWAHLRLNSSVADIKRVWQFEIHRMMRHRAFNAKKLR